MPAVDIYSINYDFMPTIPYAAKTMWLQLAFPVKDLMQGSKVKIMSLDDNFVPPKGLLTVIDVIGTRVMVETPVELREGQWGYATRYLSSYNKQRRNWTYGYGNPIGKLIYISPSSQIAQGGCCTFDFECNGWTPFGNVACCDSVCITKDSTFQTCNMACSLDPGQTCNWRDKC